ncbi:MAG: GGDEF domain-containing protein [Oscillospiraceae bacterium]|nr:GGDEF domain-containing protein [Oscillospiraceae bacterium]
MNYQEWIDKIADLAGIYSFDILPDGSFSEIYVMALNKRNSVTMAMNPNAPKFYPGIPWRAFFTDLNFENYIYNSASKNEMLYSYANAHGFWVKGFYLPLTVESGEFSDAPPVSHENARRVYCLYVGTLTPQMDANAMAQHSLEVTSAVMNISIKLHEKQDFVQSMAETVKELGKVCAAEKVALYTVDKSRGYCSFIDESGEHPDMLENLCMQMDRTPYETAAHWEEDLDDSDCLMLNDLSVLAERDPVWYKSLCEHNVKNIVLYAIRFNQNLVGFIWALNYDISKLTQIKETLEFTSFLIGAVIANHHMISRLEIMSTVDDLTKLLNRNAFNERIEQLTSGSNESHSSMGVAYADLNGLKTVNDEGGHEAGDKLLCRASALLKLAFVDCEIYRIGGDEFVVLCPDIKEAELTDMISQLRSLADSTHDVSFAVGSSWYSGSYDINKALQTADERMYQDKDKYYAEHPEKERRGVSPVK